MFGSICRKRYIGSALLPERFCVASFELAKVREVKEMKCNTIWSRIFLVDLWEILKKCDYGKRCFWIECELAKENLDITYTYLGFLVCQLEKTFKPFSASLCESIISLASASSMFVPSISHLSINANSCIMYISRYRLTIKKKRASHPSKLS